MSRNYKIAESGYPYFVTYTVIEWIDLFIRNVYREVFLDSVRYCQQEKGLVVYAWVIMPSHIHMILGSNGKMPLEGIIRDNKSFVSREIRKLLESSEESFESRKSWMYHMMQSAGIRNPNNNDFQLWMQHNQPIELNTNYLMDQKLNYIHNNPVEAGFVSNPEDWLYGSAIDYAGGKGFLDIEFLE
ncbi:MAG: transposase [Imperialibacter sp.]|uniref:REP-associated tyrosine transposase n=1 Tax=Imperialibacter sp. TaxID=2038411 RepID=UPI0032EAF1A8